MSCQKNSERQDIILQTWGKDKDLYFFSENSDESRRVLQVCDSHLSEYFNLSYKLMSLFKTIQNSFYDKYEWYFIGDDDTFVNTRLLESDLEKFDKDKIHGHDYSLYFGFIVGYLSGGAGMLINRKLIHNFFENYNLGPFEANGERYADVTFGFNMREKGIRYTHNILFLPEHPLEHHKIPLDEIHNYYTCHRIRSFEEMIYLNEVCFKNLNQ